MSKSARELVTPYRIKDGSSFRITDIDPRDHGSVRSEARAVELLQQGVSRLSTLQDRLYAQDRWAVLVILQAMDAAGKDGVIKHVMSGVNPQGCEVTSFKAPSPEELDHDYLWRAMRQMPQRGRIGIFNRSYYEEVLVVRVHTNLLQQEKIPSSLVGKRIWKERFEDMNALERYLTRNGILVLKFFLHLSKKEQTRRFLRRVNDPQRNWKFSENDVKERQYWDDYMAAYEDMIRHTATDEAPWHVVPADHKWFTRLGVAETIVEALEGMHLRYPTVDADRRQELDVARTTLMGKGRAKRKKSGR